MPRLPPAFGGVTAITQCGRQARARSSHLHLGSWAEIRGQDPAGTTLWEAMAERPWPGGTPTHEDPAWRGHPAGGRSEWLVIVTCPSALPTGDRVRRVLRRQAGPAWRAVS